MDASWADTPSASLLNGRGFSLADRGTGFGEADPDLSGSSLLAQYGMTVTGYPLCVQPCFIASEDSRLRRVLKNKISLTRSFWLIVPGMRDLARVRVTSDFIVDQIRGARQRFLPPEIVGANRCE